MGLVWGVNVGIYGIHGVYGICGVWRFCRVPHSHPSRPTRPVKSLEQSATVKPPLVLGEGTRLSNTHRLVRALCSALQREAAEHR